MFVHGTNVLSRQELGTKMSENSQGLLQRVTQHGWPSSIVVTVLFIAIVKGSIIGTLLAISAMAVLILITARRFQPEGKLPRASILFRLAIRTGTALAFLFVLLSLYWVFKPIIMTELPKQALESVITRATESELPTATMSPIPQFQQDGRNPPLFAYERSTEYEIVSAKALAELSVKSSCASFELMLNLITVIAIVWLLGALAFGLIAQEVWRGGEGSMGDNI